VTPGATEDEIRLTMSEWTSLLLDRRRKGQRVSFARNDKRQGICYLIAVASAARDEPVEFKAMAGGE
jgi:hypothetical protein